MGACGYCDLRRYEGAHMRVAIVDDEQRVREQLREYVGRFAAESGLEMQIRVVFFRGSVYAGLQNGV